MSIPQTQITADTHPGRFDDLVNILRRLDKSVVKNIRTLISRQFPDLTQGFPSRCVLPDPLVGHKVLKSAFCGLLKKDLRHRAHNLAIKQLVNMIEEDPEVFLSLINDALKEYEYLWANYEGLSC